mmetsp:Transcript_6758/g.7714  ORF Transcript_6758/g.7714 Transcript_6758/m.7714 type:complete len:159 (+) Transcript_6758:115-591(+)
MSTLSRNRKVSESAFELIYLETVSHFKEKGQNEKITDLGYIVGHKFIERFTRGKTRLSSTLDALKFLCKDVWQTLFGKTVDKLQTNHKGVFVLHDNNFKWISRIMNSTSSSSETIVEEMKAYLLFPAGLIKGALKNLGIESTVRADYAEGLCTFNIQI